MDEKIPFARNGCDDAEHRNQIKIEMVEVIKRWSACWL